MNYNKRRQAYIVLNEFFLKSNDEYEKYTRVKFTSTGHEQIVKSDLERLGQFEDESLKSEDEDTSKEESFKIGTLDISILAIDPKGQEHNLLSSELEDFCIEHKLDLEAVKLVISGQQKTHRRWRFTETKD